MYYNVAAAGAHAGQKFSSVQNMEGDKDKKPELKAMVE